MVLPMQMSHLRCRSEQVCLLLTVKLTQLPAVTTRSQIISLFGARGFFLAPLVIHIQISESLKYEKSVPLGTKEIEQLTFHRTSISCINTPKKRPQPGAFTALSTYRDCYLHCLPLLFFLSLPPTLSWYLSPSHLSCLMSVPLSLCLSVHVPLWRKNSLLP